jgi:hypothetical protein
MRELVLLAIVKVCVALFEQFCGLFLTPGFYYWVRGGSRVCRVIAC